MDESPNEIEDLGRRIETAGMSKEARGKATTELNKLKMMSPMSAEATVVRNYVDWLVNVPWKKRTRTSRDLGKAEAVLEADHYGLEKVKERIVEYLAVQTRVKKLKGPILCLVGAPGVGKTSLGQSIARATNRKFVRMSLGGVRDEAEIRGPSAYLHRRVARKDRAEHGEGGGAQSAVPAGRSRQDVDGLPRRSVLRTARSARPRAEPRLQRSLPGGRLRPLPRHVRRHREHG